jgi:hypothetical protein
MEHLQKTARRKLASLRFGLQASGRSLGSGDFDHACLVKSSILVRSGSLRFNLPYHHVSLGSL